MDVIAISSFKGGTAKTSTSLHMGAAWAKFHGKRVLLIDFDAQANLTTGLGFDPDDHDSMASVLQGEKPLEAVIVHTEIPNLDLVPADTWLERVEVTGNLASDRYSHERLREIIKVAPYDIILIDTPPSLCWLTESALIAAQHTLVCATPEFYSVKGLERLSLFLQSINQRHSMNVLGVLLSFWNSRGKNNDAFLSVAEQTFPGAVLDTKIRRDIAVTEASIVGKPLFDTAPQARASEDYAAAAAEVLTRMDPTACTSEVSTENLAKQDSHEPVQALDSLVDTLDVALNKLDTGAVDLQQKPADSNVIISSESEGADSADRTTCTPALQIPSKGEVSWESSIS